MKNRKIINGKSEVINFKKYNPYIGNSYSQNICLEREKEKIFNKMKVRKNNSEEAIDMEEKSLNTVLDRMDQDRRDQEKRLSKNMELIEKRITEERRLSEERMENRFNEVMKSIEKTNGNFEKSVERIEDKFEKLSDEVKENNKYLRNMSLTTIIGIAAMVITVAITLFVAIYKFS